MILRKKYQDTKSQFTFNTLRICKHKTRKNIKPVEIRIKCSNQLLYEPPQLLHHDNKTITLSYQKNANPSSLCLDVVNKLLYD